MSDERWKRIDRVLQSALSRPPQEREAFVREACKDDEVARDEVLSLLAHEASADKFLESPSAREPLKPGARLGAYEIRAQIGEGGMGEVYRAHDSRLRRDIALKILPPEAADAERRQRFAREAQAVAALNHPGIVTIHSVEQSGDIHFLTMELVDGWTLDALIPAGGLPIDRLLAIAVPLTDAVGTAHSQGIVHRDLKPANVMVTKDGRVKVMDFGLAKLAPRASLLDANDDPVMTTAQLTEDGRIFGTVAYMSPEQAEGRDVDHRSDVFSLGVLLFELATGRRPFTGDSQVSVLASIVKDTPPSITDLRPGLPADFSRLIRKCLAKDPARRYQSALDLRNDLEDVKESPPSPQPTAPRTPSRRWLRQVGGMAGVMTAAVAVVYFTPNLKRVVWPLPPEKSKFAVAIFQNATGDSSLEQMGRQIRGDVVAGLNSLGVSAARLEDSSVNVAAVQGTGVGRVVGGTYYLNGDTIRVEVDVREVDTADQAYPFRPIEGPRANQRAVVDTVVNYLKGAVAVDQQRNWDGSTRRSRPIPYDAWVEVREAGKLTGLETAERKLERYRRAVELAPDAYLPKLLLFNRYVWGKNEEGAEATWKEIEGMYDQLVPVSQASARLYRALALGMLPEALTASAELAALEGDLVTPLAILGETQTKNHRLIAARGTYEKALNIPMKPRNWEWGHRLEALATLSDIHHELDEFQAQWADAKRGQNDAPDSPFFFVAEAGALVGLRRPLADIDELISRATASGRFVATDAGIASMLAVIVGELRAHGRSDDAASLSKRALAEIKKEIAGTDKPTMTQQNALRTALMQSEDWQAAYLELQAVVKTQPKDVTALGSLGVVAAALGKNGEARRIADALPMVKLPYINGEQYYQRARVLASLRDADSAVVALKRSFRDGYGWVPGAIHRDAAFDPIRKDASFKVFCENKDSAVSSFGGK